MSRVVPTLAQEIPGNYLTGGLWNSSVYGLGQFTLNSPLFYGYSVASQSVGSSSWTAIGIDTSVYDIDGGHSNSTNNSRYVAQVPGRYLVIGTCAFLVNGSGARAARIEYNGNPILGGATFAANPGAIGFGASAIAVQQMAVGEYVELYGWQSSGSSLSTAPATTDLACNLIVCWISS